MALFGTKTNGRQVSIGKRKFTYNSTKGVWEKSGSTATPSNTEASLTVSNNLSAGGTFGASGLASLDGGIDVDGAFTVANTTGNTSTSGTLDVTGLTSLDGAVKIGSTTESASTVGAGGLRWKDNALQYSNGSSWEAVSSGGQDGSSGLPIYNLSDAVGVATSGDVTLYVKPGNLGDTVQYTVNFDSTKPRYKATNTGTGFCTNTSGSTGSGSCSQGTGSAYDMWSAASYCMKAGARLCSKANLGQATGSGCSHDSRGIWTTDTNSAGQHWVGQGNAPTTGGWYDPDHTGSFSGYTNNEIGIRCCGTGSNDSAYWEI